MNKSFLTTPLGLYIHFPWCTKKCPYCDFNSHTLRAPIDEKQYINTLLEDLKAQAAWAQQRPITTVFLGGGTPSLFSPEQLHRLLSNIEQIVPLAADAEITMEANPGSLNANYLKALKKTPINRLSIGVQTFDQQQLSNLGRIHNPQQAHQAIQAALDANFHRINVDIMYGLPEQTPAQAINDIETALAYPIEHLSWYQLTIEPNTYFYQHPPQQPNHDALCDIQQQGQQRIAQLGFSQYEISAYQKNQQACQHNLNYWRFGDYLGIGAGAHGKITDSDNNSIFRYWNIKHPKHYLRANTHYQAEIKTVAQDQLPGEFMLNALRLREPILFSHFEASTGLHRKVLEQQLLLLEKQELIAVNSNGFELTARGLQFADDAVMEFMELSD